MPYFSIIIPCFNSASCINHCISSIINQTFADFEVLILDGKSSDDTVSVASRFNDVRIRIFSEPDNGIYDAMNKGISLATGSWLYFIGSDDELFDFNVFEDIYTAIEHNSVQLLYGNVFFKNAKTVYGTQSSSKSLLFESNICHQAIFYNRVVFELLGTYLLQYKLWADWDFNLRCFKNPLIQHLYFHRTIALYNDGQGKSGIEEDELLKQELPVFLNRQIQNLTHELKDVKSKPFYKLNNKIFSLVKSAKRLLIK